MNCFAVGGGRKNRSGMAIELVVNLTPHLPFSPFAPALFSLYHHAQVQDAAPPGQGEFVSREEKQREREMKEERERER